jgi:DNA-binding transcriptional regulator GbsR (MarR family)
VNQVNTQQALIKEPGLVYENIVMTRMANRILGYMMVSDKEHISFNEFTEVIYASKSSISSNLKALMEVGYIKMVSLPSDRKTYYKLNNEIKNTENIGKQMMLFNVMLNLHDHAIQLLVNQNDEQSRWTKKTAHFYRFFAEVLQSLIEGYRKEYE